MGGDGDVIGQVVLLGEDGVDREALALVHTGEDGAHAGSLAAVIADGFQGGLDGVAGGDGGRQHQHVLAHDHGGVVLTEEQLGAGGVLGGHNVNGVVGVVVGIAAAGEFGGDGAADQLGAVQAEDGVDDGHGADVVAQLGGDLLGLGQTVLGHRQVDVIVEVAVAGGKVAHRHAQRHIGVVGAGFKQTDRHNESPLVTLFSGLVHI